jgi:hypothetical protein
MKCRKGHCLLLLGTYNWDSPCHEGESKSGQEHNNEDNLFRWLAKVT